jgi:hypothetical protein
MAQLPGHGHKNRTYSTGMRTWKHDTCHRYQGMEMRHMVHVSTLENWTHGTGFRTWKQDTSAYIYQDMETGQMVHVSQHGNWKTALTSGHGNRTHGTGVRTWK